MVQKVDVDSDGAFEILVGDVMRQEPFPNEIKVIGKGLGWPDRLRGAALKRGLKLVINVTYLSEAD